MPLSRRGLIYDTGSSVNLIVQYLAGICIGAVLVRWGHQDSACRPGAGEHLWAAHDKAGHYPAYSRAHPPVPTLGATNPGLGKHVHCPPHWAPGPCPAPPQPPPTTPLGCSLLFIVLMAFPVLISKSLDAPAVLVSKGRGMVTQGGRMAMVKGRQAYQEGKDAVAEAAAKGRQAYQEGKEAVAGAASALGGNSKKASRSAPGATRPRVDAALIPAEPEAFPASVSAALAAGPELASTVPATDEQGAEPPAAEAAVPLPPAGVATAKADVEAGLSTAPPSRSRSLLITSSGGVLRTACVGCPCCTRLRAMLGCPYCLLPVGFRVWQPGGNAASRALLLSSFLQVHHLDGAGSRAVHRRSCTADHRHGELHPNPIQNGSIEPAKGSAAPNSGLPARRCVRPAS